MLDAEALAAMLAPIIADEVEKAVSPLNAKIAVLEARKPEKGEKGDPGEKGEAGDRGVDGVNGSDGAGGRDGRGVKDLLIDRNGHLVATMDDGETKGLGPVVGKDGEAGRDGRDGFDLTSFDAQVLDDDRTVELKFVSGEHEHVVALKWPTMIDRGVYQEGREYDAGDTVSWAGSMWTAQRATNAKPETKDSGWRLAVKRGRDGKDAKLG